MRVLPRISAMTPIFVSISRMAVPLSLSLCARRSTPCILLCPLQKAARTEIIGNKSGQLVASVSNAERGARQTVMSPLSPSVWERLAPASIKISMIERSACREVVSSPSRTTFPNTAPATRKLAAALQSPSIVISADLYLCPPLMRKVISVQYVQSPPDSMNSRGPVISFLTVTPNFFITSSVMNIYGMLFGEVTSIVELPSAKGRAITRPEINCEPSFPEISALPGQRDPHTFSGTLQNGAGFPWSFAALSTQGISPSTIRTPKRDIIRGTPFKGLFNNVPSPFRVTSLEAIWETSGIISLVSKPDSPTLSSSMSTESVSADIPLIVSRFASMNAARESETESGDAPTSFSTVTSAPRERATLIAASLSEQGV